MFPTGSTTFATDVGIIQIIFQICLPWSFTAKMLTSTHTKLVVAFWLEHPPFVSCPSLHIPPMQQVVALVLELL